MLFPPGPAGPAKKNAKLVATLILCSSHSRWFAAVQDKGTPSLTRGARSINLSPGMILAAVQTGPGSGRRARSPHGGNLSPIPCRHPCLKPYCLLLPVRHSFPLTPRTRKYTVQSMPFRPVPKRMPRKIRYARPVACQGGQNPPIDL